MDLQRYGGPGTRRRAVPIPLMGEEPVWTPRADAAVQEIAPILREKPQ
jgi:hypothetical protein